MRKCIDIDTLEWTVCGTIDLGNLAPWIQAIGSIFAIIVATGVAIYILRADHRRQDKQDKRKARSLAIALFPELMEMKAKMQTIRLPDGAIYPAPIKFPPELIRSIDKLYLLEKAGDVVQEFLSVARQLDRMMEDKRGGPALTGEIAKSLYTHLDIMESHLEIALDLVGIIRDTKV